MRYLPNIEKIKLKGKKMSNLDEIYNEMIMEYGMNPPH